MGVYIKDMEMPTNCMDCPFKGFDRVKGRGDICTINDSITLHAVLDGLDIKFVRMGDCPLVLVPPHGRLIDADAVTNAAMENILMWEEDGYDRDDYRGFLANYIDDAPTIIPAEEGE